MTQPHGTKYSSSFHEKGSSSKKKMQCPARPSTWVAWCNKPVSRRMIWSPGKAQDSLHKLLPKEGFLFPPPWANQLKSVFTNGSSGIVYKNLTFSICQKSELCVWRDRQTGVCPSQCTVRAQHPRNRHLSVICFLKSEQKFSISDLISMLFWWQSDIKFGNKNLPTLTHRFPQIWFSFWFLFLFWRDFFFPWQGPCSPGLTVDWKLIWNHWCSCLYHPRTRVTDMVHHAWMKETSTHSNCWHKYQMVICTPHITLTGRSIRMPYRRVSGALPESFLLKYRPHKLLTYL